MVANVNSKKQIAVTPAALTRWNRLNERRLELMREAKDLEKQCNELLDAFYKYVKSNRRKSITLGRGTINISKCRKAVAWKQEFVARHGEAAAQRIIAQQPEVEYVEVSFQ